MGSVIHDEVEIEDFEYDEEEDLYFYPCPCGDRFEISKVRFSIFPHVVYHKKIGFPRKTMTFFYFRMSCWLEKR